MVEPVQQVTDLFTVRVGTSQSEQVQQVLLGVPRGGDRFADGSGQAGKLVQEGVDAFEGVLQRAWDRELSRRPVLLVLIGSDLSMMETLGSYGRPFHQRGQEMVLGPLNPAEVGQMLRLEPAEAFDAALVTGGLPLTCAAWRPGDDLWTLLAAELANPVSALLVSAERSLAAELPESANARAVLSAIGSGERTFTNIARAAGGIPHASLTRSTDVLTAKRIVVGELPIWTRPSRERRYRVTDPYLSASYGPAELLTAWQGPG